MTNYKKRIRPNAPQKYMNDPATLSESGQYLACCARRHSIELPEMLKENRKRRLAPPLLSGVLR